MLHMQLAAQSRGEKKGSDCYASFSLTHDFQWITLPSTQLKVSTTSPVDQHHEFIHAWVTILNGSSFFPGVAGKLYTTERRKSASRHDLCPIANSPCRTNQFVPTIGHGLRRSKTRRRSIPRTKNPMSCRSTMGIDSDLS
jgi:hypothetical protein